MKDLFMVLERAGKTYIELMYEAGYKVQSLITEQKTDLVFCIDRDTHNDVMQRLGIFDHETSRVIRSYRIKVVK